MHRSFPVKHLFQWPILFLAVLFGDPYKGHASAITTWTSSLGTTSNLSTDSPILGNGTAGSALNALIYAPVDSYTLSSVGDSLTFSGTVTLSDITGTLARGFRWGLFNNNGSSNSNGWLGYFAGEASGTGTGMIMERTSPNTGSWWSATGASTLVNPSEPSSNDFVEGTYSLSISVLLSSSNTLTIYWLLQGVDVSYSYSGSYIDPSPQTLTFNCVGVGTSSLGASEIEFSNMEIVFTQVPEPDFFMMGILAAGAAGFALRSRKVLRCEGNL